MHKIVSSLKHIGKFLHIIDNDGKLDLIDLSFVGMVVKVLISPNIDFPSVCSLVGVILAKMHRTHLEANSDDSK
jgi:hypothetical protein